MAPELETEEEGTEEAAVSEPADDLVLDEEPDEADISGLVGHHDEQDAKER